MPLIALAVGSYLAGLLAGFNDVAPIAIGVAAAAFIGALLLGRPLVVALAVLVAAGALAASATSRAHARCASQVVRQQTFVVQIDDAAAPGAYIRGQLDVCGANVWIAVERGLAAAGSTAIVEATPGSSAR